MQTWTDQNIKKIYEKAAYVQIEAQVTNMKYVSLCFIEEPTLHVGNILEKRCPNVKDSVDALDGCCVYKLFCSDCPVTYEKYKKKIKHELKEYIYAHKIFDNIFTNHLKYENHTFNIGLNSRICIKITSNAD